MPTEFEKLAKQSQQDTEKALEKIISAYCGKHMSSCSNSCPACIAKLLAQEGFRKQNYIENEELAKAFQDFEALL